MTYPFPGNIRELENMVERAVILAAGANPIGLHDLFGENELQKQMLTMAGDEGPASGPLDQVKAVMSVDADELPTIKELEQVLINRALEKSGGNLTAAARMIGLTRRQFAYRAARLTS